MHIYHNNTFSNFCIIRFFYLALFASGGDFVCYDDRDDCDFPYELTQNNINEIYALISRLTAEDWEKLREDVNSAVISDGNGSFILMV